MELATQTLESLIEWGSGDGQQAVTAGVTALAVGATALWWSKSSGLTRRLDDHFLVDEIPEHNFKYLGKKMAETRDEVRDCVREMRLSTSTGVARPIATRVAQLHALKRMMEENRERIIGALAEDLGRTTWEATYYDYYFVLAEIEMTLKNLRKWLKPEKQPMFLLSQPSASYVYKEPWGMTTVIGTWNYPVMLLVAPVMGAIAGGNTVVVKPCMQSPACAKLMAELLTKYLDPRIVTVVGTGETGDRHVTGELLKEKFDYIFFTGSPVVGKVICRAAAEHLTPCTLELGGKNPVYVHKDADLHMAAKRTVWGRNMNAGQQCISPDYVLCHEDVVEQFEALCVKYVGEMYGEHPDTNGNLGKIVGIKQHRRIVDMLETSGGEVLVGGTYDEATKYIAPTVVRVALDSPAMTDETFGPILWVAKVRGVREAINHVNAGQKPLTMYIFTSDEHVRQQLVQNTSAGGITVNATLYHVGNPNLPFGGVGESGMGSYHGKHTLDTFVHPKPVMIKTLLPDGGVLSDPFFVYPPWTPGKLKLLDYLRYIM